MSLVSMLGKALIERLKLVTDVLVLFIGPSPDWIVGVSALELCLRNCSWVESKTLNLYPWDAGTDSGITYMVTMR